MTISKQRGFTLVEILVVISIIGLLFFLIIPRVDQAFIKASEVSIKTDFHDFQIASESLLRESNGKRLYKDSLNLFLDKTHEIKYEESFAITSSQDYWGNPYLVEFSDRKVSFVSNGKTGKKEERAYLLVSYYYKGVVSSCTVGFSSNNLTLNLPDIDDTFSCGNELPDVENDPIVPESGSLNAPADFIASAITNSSATLSWSRVSGATQYVLKRNGVTIYIGSSAHFFDTALSPNVTYTYTVVARNSNLISDPSSLSLKTLTGPSAPNNFTSQNITTSSIDLSWNAVSNATGYILYRNDAVIYTGSATSYKDIGLATYTNYRYDLVATNQSGVSPKVTHNAKTLPTKETIKLPDIGLGSCAPYNPYIITTVGELQGINLDLSACYKLGNNIDATVTQNWNNGQGFSPIGSSESYAKVPAGMPSHMLTDDLGLWGKFDGSGYTISNLYINRPNTKGVGLFGANMGEIKNVKVTNAEVIGNKDVGILIGGAADTSIVLNAQVSGTVRGDIAVGGLMAFNAGTVENSEMSGDIYNSGAYTGGVIGESHNNGVVRQIHFSGNIYAGTTSGGLIGYNKGVLIDSVSDGTIYIQDRFERNMIGGIVGNNLGLMSGIMNNSTIYGWGTSVGGVVGSNKADGVISNITNNSQVHSIGINVGPFYGTNVGTIN